MYIYWKWRQLRYICWKHWMENTERLSLWVVNFIYFQSKYKIRVISFSWELRRPYWNQHRRNKKNNKKKRHSCNATVVFNIQVVRYATNSLQIQTLMQGWANTTGKWIQIQWYTLDMEAGLGIPPVCKESRAPPAWCRDEMFSKIPYDVCVLLQHCKGAWLTCF